MVITKLPNTEQSSKGKFKTHKSINRQNQSTTGKLENRNGPDLVQAFLKKWWIESDFTAPTSRFHYGSKVPVVTKTAFTTILEKNRQNSSQTVPNSVSNISREPSPSTMSPLKYFNYDCKCQKYFYVTHSQKYF